MEITNKIISIPDTPGTYWFRDHAKDSWKLVFVEDILSGDGYGNIINKLVYTILVQDNCVNIGNSYNVYNAEWVKIELPSVDENAKSGWGDAKKSYLKNVRDILGYLPEDAWHLYWSNGLIPIEAVKQHIKNCKFDIENEEEYKAELMKSITKTGQSVLSNTLKTLGENFISHNGPEAGPGDLT